MLMEEKQDGRQVKWPHVWERFRWGRASIYLIHYLSSVLGQLNYIVARITRVTKDLLNKARKLQYH